MQLTWVQRLALIAITLAVFTTRERVACASIWAPEQPVYTISDESAGGMGTSESSNSPRPFSEPDPSRPNLDGLLSLLAHDYSGTSGMSSASSVGGGSVGLACTIYGTVFIFEQSLVQWLSLDGRVQLPPDNGVDLLRPPQTVCSA